MDNLINSFQEHIRDRLSSPLAAAFAVSWGLINYRFLLVLFSGKSVEEKLLFIDQIHFSSLQQTLLSGIAYPLLAAVFFILIYPPVSRLVMVYLLGQQRLAREIRQVIEQETPMSKEEAAELRRQFNSRIAELESEVSRRQQTVASLRQNEEALEAHLEDRRKEINALQNKRNEEGLNLTILQNKAKEASEKLERAEMQLQTAMQQISQLNEKLADKDEQHNNEKRELIKESLELSAELSELRRQVRENESPPVKLSPVAAGLLPISSYKLPKMEPIKGLLDPRLWRGGSE